jgi:hypothetical protein
LASLHCGVRSTSVLIADDFGLIANDLDTQRKKTVYLDSPVPTAKAARPRLLVEVLGGAFSRWLLGLIARHEHRWLVQWTRLMDAIHRRTGHSVMGQVVINQCQ